MDKNIDAAVGMTRKWDAREAGREVARDTIQQLDGPPNFFVLFSTIHYKDNGGFEEFLKGVWDVLPKGTPLVGGTVVGFMNNYGCFTRGASALAVSYPNVDVVIGYGKNVKRNPKKAVIQCSQMIKKGFKSSKYGNKFLLNFVSGPLLMKIPGQGFKKVVDSGFMGKMIPLVFGISQYLLQKGFGREDEVFEEIVKRLPDYHMILGTSMDNNLGLTHYQFINDEIMTNSVVTLGFSTDLEFDVCTTHGMRQTDRKFKITKLSRNRHIIREINNKPAVPELYNIFNWPDDFLTEKTMINIIPYYPISLKRHGREVPAVMPFILNDSIMTPCVIDDGDVSILTISGKDIIKAMRENMNSFERIQPEFSLSSTCVTLLSTFGYKMNIVQEEFLNKMEGKPFLMFFSAGEGTYSPKNNITYANMSYNSAIFGQNKNNV